MDPRDLVTLFTSPEPRTVRQHGVQVKDQFWTCDGLLTFLGDRVIVHIPRYHGFSALRVTDGQGNEIGIATSDRPFEVLDQRGAQESARRGSLRNRAITALGKTVPDIDIGQELVRFGQRQAPVIPNAPDAVISVNRTGHDGLALPATRRPKEQTPEKSTTTRGAWTRSAAKPCPTPCKRRFPDEQSKSEC